MRRLPAAPTSEYLPLLTAEHGRRAAGLAPPFARQAAEIVVAVVDVGHRGGEQAMAGDLGDLAVHLAAEVAVGLVAPLLAAQLEDVESLPGVELEIEADLVGERH